MDTPAQRKFDKLYRNLRKANVACKKALERLQTAIAKYHWTEPDDGWKWRKVLAAGDKHTAASKKAEDALMSIPVENSPLYRSKIPHP